MGRLFPKNYQLDILKKKKNDFLPIQLSISVVISMYYEKIQEVNNVVHKMENVSLKLTCSGNYITRI